MNQIDIVVPDGSMQDVIIKLFAKAGLPVTIERQRTKEGKVAGVEWIKRVAFQRPQEIPHYLANGHFDVAIVGEDWIANWDYKFPILLVLPIGRWGNKPVNIVLAASQGSGFKTIEELPQDCEVATEYVQLVQRFFLSKKRQDIIIVPSYGNTEHKVRFGAAAIVDVTESGDSLRENQLEVICEIMKSNTVVVANPESLADGTKQPYIDCFVRLINGAYQASKYVMLTANVPEQALDEASRIIGGLKGPSCLPLKTKEWFALQSVVPRENEQKIIFELLQIGVTDIVVIRDIPMIMT
ncbi:ATP phosphoribosyltransferase [Patescibacteria group bacterium]|nr:ATP phosphoribosyltransferase [Patescibacteria group bacterium]